MQLHIASPTETYETLIAWIELETETGTMIVLPGHAPMIVTLRPLSCLYYRLRSGKEETTKVAHGIAHITRGSITVLLTNS